MSLTAARKDLRWALSATIRHVCADGYLPSLCGVRLEVVPAEKTLYCVATDRYTIGAAMVPYEGDHEAVETTVPTAEVRDLIRKLAGKETAELLVTESCVEVDGFYRFRAGSGAPLPGFKGPFAGWRKILGDMLARDIEPPADDTGYDPKYLARFAPVARDGSAVSVVTVRGAGEAFPARTTLVMADGFIGAAMGRMREPLISSRVAAWRDRIKVTEEKP